MKKILILALVILNLSNSFVISAEAQNAGEGGYSLEEALSDSLKNVSEKRETQSGTDIRTQEAKNRRPIHLVGVSNELRGDSSDITSYLQSFASGIITIAGVLAVVMLLVNSLRLVASLGDSDAITKAKKGITWALVGLLVMMGAFVAVRSTIELTYVADGPQNDYSGLTVTGSLDLCLPDSAQIIETNLSNLQEIDQNINVIAAYKEESEIQLREQQAYFLGDGDPENGTNTIKANKQREAQGFLTDTQRKISDIDVLLQNSQKDRDDLYSSLNRALLNCGTYKETSEVELLDTHTGKAEDVEVRLTDATDAKDQAYQNTTDLMALPLAGE